jgi:diacylglycerol kinase
MLWVCSAYEHCTVWTDFVWCIFRVLLSGSRDFTGLYSTSFVSIGLFVFVNSIEYRVINIDVIVTEVFVLFKRAKDMKSFQCIQMFPLSFYFYNIHNVFYATV